MPLTKGSGVTELSQSKTLILLTEYPGCCSYLF